MRKSVKPVPVWPSNGAVYPRRAPSYPDSYNRRFLNQSCRFPQSKTCHGEHTTIFLSRNRRLRKFDQLCRIDDGLRRFSASTPKESDGFDEEEEDDLAASSSEMSRMVRRRVNPIKEAEERARQKREEEQVLMRRREELQERVDRRANELRTAVVLLQKIKQHAEEQRRAHEEWMRRYEQVITNSGTLVNAESQLFEEYFTLKYSEAGVVGSFIDNNARVLGQSQAEVSNCRQALRRIELASRRIDLEMQLARFAATLGSVAETFSDYHVTPIASARRNMENLLMPLTRFSSQYVDLQESGYKINLGNVRIISLLKEIDIKDPMRKYFHAKLQEKVDNGNNELMLTLHEYRSVKRILQWRGPLGQSHMLTMVQNYFSYRVIEMLASDLRMTKGRLINNLHTHGSASLLAHWYLPRWKEGAPRSVNLDIAWRHLDVYHSFDLLYISTRRISIEVRRLSAVLSETGDFGIRSLISLKEWSRAFIVMHSATLNNIEMLRCYTWLRLETENKVSKLGGVPDTISRGLFTPKDPISSDLRRFFLYADAIGDGMAQCINLGEALERFGRLKQPTTSDLIKLIDFSPSSRRGLDRLPGIAKSVPMRKVLNSRVPTRKVLNSRVPMRKVLISSVPMRKVLISSVHVRKVLISRRKTTPLRQTNERVPPGRSQARPLGVSDVQALLKRAGARMKRANTTNPEAILTTTGMSKVKITAPPSRRYYTDSKSFANHDGRQCGVSEPEIALINKDQIVQTELSSSIRAEDIEAADSLVSDAKHPDIISSHVLPDNSDDNKPQFWSYSQHRTPDGGKIPVYYCKDLERAERAAALFSSSEVLGFDIEWKPQAQITSGIKNNVSLIQIANEERIALFHIALFRGNEIDDLVPPSLRHLLESTRTVKVGVSIKADCSRVRRHLGIDTRSQLELSHLYKLVKYGSTQPKLVDRRTVNLAQQVEEVLGLPLRKDGDVRKSDWTKPLDYAQVQYAASDAYACICLHRILDAKRKALDPVPPLPAFAELNLPILLVEEGKGTLEALPDDEILELSLRTERSLKVVVKPEKVKDDVVVKIEN